MINQYLRVRQAKIVPAALSPLQVSASNNGVMIQSREVMSDLLEELASGRYFVYRVQSDGTLMGTGPFFIAGSSPASPCTCDFAGMKRLGRDGRSWMRLR
jgi:hypothetical protein